MNMQWLKAAAVNDFTWITLLPGAFFIKYPRMFIKRMNHDLLSSVRGIHD